MRRYHVRRQIKVELELTGSDKPSSVWREEESAMPRRPVGNRHLSHSNYQLGVVSGLLGPVTLQAVTGDVPALRQ